MFRVAIRLNPRKWDWMPLVYWTPGFKGFYWGGIDLEYTKA